MGSKQAGERVLRILGLGLALAGYLGIWVPHETAALTVTGAELAEYAKFFPQVQGGVVPVARWLFVSPLVAAAVLAGLVGNRLPLQPIVRAAFTALAAVLALGALPPYDYLLSPDYRWQLLLACGGATLSLLTPLSRRLPDRAWGGLVALLALAGAVPTLWQWTRLRPLVVDLYAAPLGLGWGVIVCPAGFALVALAGSIAALGSRRDAQTELRSISSLG